jgi:5-methyltetrahydropteroyltriglutamate--homocysteine methyltransferase
MAEIMRTDQVGSLLRPQELLEARASYGEGKITLEQLRETEDKAILKALEMQRKIGIDMLVDGEFRRRAFYSGPSDWIEGFVPSSQPRIQEWFGPGGGKLPSASRVVGAKLRHRRFTAHETFFLREHAQGRFKITLPCPSQLFTGSFQKGVTDQFYPTPADLLEDLSGIVQTEIKAAVADGASYIQTDSPNYSDYISAAHRQKLTDTGINIEKHLGELIAADNACLAGAKREGAITGFHVCRGNSRSRWQKEGGYEPIAEQLFGSLTADRILLEYDTERAGGFEPLRFVPAGPTVVLGLISTKGPVLESKDHLLRRIEEASRYVPVERLALSPQCGFASTLAGNLLTEDDQWKKLELVVNTAHEVWG